MIPGAPSLEPGAFVSRRYFLGHHALGLGALALPILLGRHLLAAGANSAPAAASTGDLSELPDISTVPADLQTPPMTGMTPAAGRRVRQITPGWDGTDIYHALYLPAGWKPGGKFPVLVEYPGNSSVSKFGDVSPGVPEGSSLGYGVAGEGNFIWVCLPFVKVTDRRREIAKTWWGDVDETSRYCKNTVRFICEQFGGDPKAVILCGFSRGAIACNYIGLRDEEIASLWRGFVCHSHYDGVRKWDYPGADRGSALERLRRLNGRPQFISHEGSTAPARTYLESTGVAAPFTFVDVPFHNHTDAWVLRDCEPRRKLRAWLKSLVPF